MLSVLNNTVKQQSLTIQLQQSEIKQLQSAEGKMYTNNFEFSVLITKRIEKYSYIRQIQCNQGKTQKLKKKYIC